MTAQAGDTLFLDDAARRKIALRFLLRARRVAIPRAQRIATARVAARRLLRALPRRCAIAIYLSVRSELPTAPLRAALHRAGHRVRVPVTLRDGRLRFVAIRKNTPLRAGRHALPQPVARRGYLPARRLDVILLPLLGFDAEGHRLGNGGGYYDRALAAPRIGRRPRLIGYAYAAQETPAIPVEPWDVRLDAIVTERGLRRFPKSP